MLGLNTDYERGYNNDWYGGDDGGYTSYKATNINNEGRSYGDEDFSNGIPGSGDVLALGRGQWCK